MKLDKDHTQERIKELVDGIMDNIFNSGIVNDEWLSMIETEQLYVIRQLMRLAATQGIAAGTAETVIVLGREMNRIFNEAD